LLTSLINPILIGVDTALLQTSIYVKTCKMLMNSLRVSHIIISDKINNNMQKLPKLRNFFSTLLAVSLIIFPVSTFAARPSMTPELTNKSERNEQNVSPSLFVNGSSVSKKQSGDVNATAVSYVAYVTIFADPTSSGGGSSSGSDGSFDFGTHAFITIKNMSSSNINVGKFSGIAPGKTMSLGTWGNKSEHNGLWYDLESYFVYYNSAYSGRVSVTVAIDQNALNILNSYVINNDYWSTFTNCSSFAVGAWNSFMPSNYNLSAGYPNTPKKLTDNIKSKFPTY
jgi:hypothetical protein